MSWRKALSLGVLLAIVAAGAAAATALTHDHWLDWFAHKEPEKKPEPPHVHEGEVHFSDQALDNLKPQVKRVAPVRSFPRYVQVTGKVIERPGQSDFGISAPASAVITAIHKVPGDVLRPGDRLMSFQLLSESLHNAQAQLYKTARDLDINRKEQARLRVDRETEALFKSRLIELGYEAERLKAAIETYRQELRARLPLPYLSEEELNAIETRGEFLTKPMHLLFVPPTTESRGTQTASLEPLSDKPVFELEKLRVKVGDQVQAGQLLAEIGWHEFLFIEGQALAEQLPLVQQAMLRGWPVLAEVLNDDPALWAKPAESSTDRTEVDLTNLSIVNIAFTHDAATRRYSFHVLLPNERRLVRSASTGRESLLWRFSDGKIVRLKVKVGEFKGEGDRGVFVLPLAAVVRDGPEAFVFLQNGNRFIRKPVRVLYEDAVSVVIKDDGSIEEDDAIAHANAAAIMRALKAQQQGNAGGHDHHGHDHPH